MLGRCNIWEHKDEWWGEWQVRGGEVHEDSGQLEGHPGVDTGLLGMVHQEQEGCLQDGQMLDQSHQEGILSSFKKICEKVPFSGEDWAEAGVVLLGERHCPAFSKAQLWWALGQVQEWDQGGNATPQGIFLKRIKSSVESPFLKVQRNEKLLSQEEKIGPKVQRCLDIWEEREVFDSDFIQVGEQLLTCLYNCTYIALKIMRGEMYIFWGILLELTLNFLGVDWPHWFDPSEGRWGDCWELSANSAVHTGIYCLCSLFRKHLTLFIFRSRSWKH